MSTAVAAQSSSSQSKRMSRELDRRPSRSSPRTQHTAIAYGPIGGTTKPAAPLLRRSPGSPRSQNEDERAASALQQLTAGQYGKIGSPRDTHTRSVELGFIPRQPSQRFVAFSPFNQILYPTIQSETHSSHLTPTSFPHLLSDNPRHSLTTNHQSNKGDNHRSESWFSTQDKD